MAEAAINPLERAQQLAGWAATAAFVGATFIVLWAAAEGASPALDALVAHRVTFDLPGMLALLHAFGLFWVVALPSFLLAWALYDLSGVLDEYGKGQFFTLKASAGIRKAAEGALWALGFKIVASPTIYSWITQEGRGFIWHAEPFDLGLIGFAAFVAVLGRVLEAAARIKEDNDAIV